MSAPPTIATTIPFALFEGVAISADVPSIWPVALDGHGLVLDIHSDRWRHQSIPRLRQQADQSQRPAEASLNPEGLWRRAQDDWTHGAGQTYFDRPGSDEQRYRSSKGIDPWTPYQISLLPDTDQKRSSANSSLRAVVAGSRLYVTDGATGGTNLAFTSDITVDTPSFTNVTGTASATANGVCSDGKYVYVAYSASGVYITNTGISTAAQWISSGVNGPIAFVKGRLMCSNDNSIYNITTAPTTAGPTALPTALYTARDGFIWVGFAAGPAHIFAAGFVGDKSLIYAIAIKADGTSLEVPTLNRDLPDGEIIASIDAYLGFILLGTNKGVRFCVADDSGNLVVGSLISTNQNVLAFEGQEKYVWFGWDNYDSTSTGLGRMDMTTFVESVETGARTPAYASDLMVTGAGVIRSIVTFQSIRFFAVDGKGFYAQWTNKVASGTIETGFITYGLPDSKFLSFVGVRTDALRGSYTADISSDGGAYDTVGSESSAGDTSSEFPAEQTEAERFELRLTLTRDSNAALGPTIIRYTLRAAQGAIDGPSEFIVAPFLLHTVVDYLGEERRIDVAAERNHIKDLFTTQQPTTYQEVDELYNVTVYSYEWVPYNWAEGERETVGTPSGTMVTTLKRVY